MKKFIINSTTNDLPNMRDLFPDREFFSVKFKGKQYDDAWEDECGHIWFDNNKCEYIPANIAFRHEPYVTLHGFQQSGAASWSHKSSKSTAKVTILK